MEQAAQQLPPILTFVLTGGPCGGKTTALDRLAGFFRDNGFKVYTVPEAATLMFMNGVSFPDIADPTMRFSFQWSILSLQTEMEDGFRRVALAQPRPAVLLCDRGLLDGAAYMPKSEWERLLAARGLNAVALREGRYDGVFHLVTAADGAEAFYSLESNATRTETLELAREMDANTQRVWLGHPQHVVFDNSTDFDRKIARIVAAASRIAGLPALQREDRKFVLEEWPDLAAFPVPHQEFEVEKIYLRHEEEIEGEGQKEQQGAGGCSSCSGGAEACGSAGAGACSGCGCGGSGGTGRDCSGDGDTGTGGGRCNGCDDAPPTHRYSFVRKRTQNGFSAYGLTTVRQLPTRQCCETKRIIGGDEYARLVRLSADPRRHVVRQRRVSFLWRHQSFVLQRYVHPAGAADVLHCQTEAAAATGGSGGGSKNGGGGGCGGDGASSSSGDACGGDGGSGTVVLPPFLRVGPPVAHDHSYSAYAISLKGGE